MIEQKIAKENIRSMFAKTADPQRTLEYFLTRSAKCLFHQGLASIALGSK